MSLLLACTDLLLSVLLCVCRQAEPGVLHHAVQAVRECVSGLSGESGHHQGNQTRSSLLLYDKARLVLC